MNVIALTVALVFVVIGVVSQRVRSPQTPDPNGDTDVLSDEDSYASPSATPNPPTVAPTVLPVPTFTIAPTPLPTTTSIPSGDMKSLQYPGSSVLQSSDTSMSLTSGDSPDAITQWYKAYIEAQHMNVKSFVTTKANDKVHNVLVGAGNGEIRITITKDSGQSDTSITVSRS